MTRPDVHFELVDDDTGLSQSVSVAYPYRYGRLERVPVIVTLDAPWMWGTVVDATRIMSMGGEAPEAVVVGLGFGRPPVPSVPGDQVDRPEGAGPGGISLSEYLRERARWYTPTPWSPPEATGVKALDPAGAGRAADLQAFIGRSLLPRLASAELADAELGDRWFVGHSFGGLFGLRALLTEPSLFDHWLLASPSIWWDDRAVLRWEAERAESGAGLDANVFMSYGGEEDEAVFRMGGNARDLHRTLIERGYTGLSIALHRVEGHGHNAVIGSAVAHGLRALGVTGAV